jgi:hypothetical protein
MTLLVTLAALLLAATAPDQSYRLDPGDFRWIQFSVGNIPVGVTCRFQVLQGDASVHAELVRMSEFNLFKNGRKYDTMAFTATGKSGEFRRVIDGRGQYAVIIANEDHAPPAVVSLQMDTNAGPNARTLPAGRQLTVVLTGLAFFFITVGWSTRKLVLAMHTTTRSD